MRGLLIQVKLFEINWNFAWMTLPALDQVKGDFIVGKGEGEKRGGREKKGKGDGAGFTTFRCGCSLEFSSSLNIEGNLRL